MVNLLKAAITHSEDEAIDEDVGAAGLGEGVDRRCNVFGEFCEGEGAYMYKERCISISAGDGSVPTRGPKLL